MFAKDRMGFMPGLFVAFLEELKPEEREKLLKLKDEKNRAEFVLKHPFICDKFDNIAGFDNKNNLKAARAREEGNKAFQAGNYKAALSRYNTAVCHAEYKTAASANNELCLALANRSAALQRLKHHTRGVQDVDTALEAGYPLDKQFKLLERKGQMLVELKRYDDARECFNKAKKLVQNSSLNETKIEKFKSDTDTLIKKLENKTNVQKQKESDKESIISKIQDVHPKYPSLHASVKIKYTKDQGRFAVADCDIPPGTTIMVEDPLGWALEAEKFSNHCQHCLCDVSVPVPCFGCPTVVFCSDTCRNEAWTRYHSRECGILSLCVAAALNNFCLLSVRALTRCNVKQILELTKDTCTPDIEHGTTCSDMGTYNGDDIINGLNLVHHSETLSCDDQIMRTLVSVFLMKCLQKTKFYSASNTTSEDDYHIASVIHRMISACPANTHEMHVLATPTRDKWSPLAELQQLGAGLYPTAALFNHSCDPNIVRCNVGKKMISVTSRTIKKGEEIHDCYGLPWYSKSREVRQEITSKFYKFTCQCPACEQHWTTSDMLATLTLQDINKKFGNVSINLDQVKSHVKKAVESMTHLTSDWDEAIINLKDAYNSLNGLSPPLLELFNLHISVWKSIWLRCGNKTLSKLF